MQAKGLPAVSVGLPVYNGAGYLEEALAGLRGQTFEDFELLISDNASTDETESICRQAAVEDRRIAYDRLPRNLGAAANYNRLVHAARGKWFRWASHDDVVDESLLEVLVQYLESSDGAPVLAYPKSVLIDQDGNKIRDHEDNLDLREPQPYQRLAHLAWRWGKCHPVFGLIDRQRLLQTDLIGPYIGSDVTLLAELALLGEFHEVPQRLFHRRIHSESSRQGDLTLDQIAHWFDTSQFKAPRLQPRNVVMGKIVEGVFRSPLPTAEKVRCAAAYCGTWGVRRLRMRGGAIKQRMRDTSSPAKP